MQLLAIKNYKQTNQPADQPTNKLTSTDTAIWPGVLGFAISVRLGSGGDTNVELLFSQVGLDGVTILETIVQGLINITTLWNCSFNQLYIYNTYRYLYI